MLLIYVVLFVSLTYAQDIPIIKLHVVNGTDAEKGELPYIVSLRKYNSHSCGGTILDEQHILTAAHCVSGLPTNIFTVQYGTLKITLNNFQSIPLKEVYVHELYRKDNGTRYPNDVAVLKLQSAIPLDENVQPITLPEQDEGLSVNASAVVAGWGYPYTGGDVMTDLQRANITTYNDEDCKKAHGSKVDSSYHLCAGIPEGGKGQCSGDSGGPLIANSKQIGIVSWSVKPCAVKGYPGVYTKVANYVNWINDKKNL